MSFFERLLAGDVRWALHTTFSSDLNYVAALLKAQHCATDDTTAIFYNDGEKSWPGYKGRGAKAPLQTLRPLLHPLKNAAQQTFHAKISLVCYGGETAPQYRLAVYSKNMEFNNSCCETALLFDLIPTEDATESGQQLQSFLKKLKASTDDNGKAWLADHNVDWTKFKLQSEFGAEATLYFGGCEEKEPSLGERMQLHAATPDSVVLTPPSFLCKNGNPTKAWEVFSEWTTNGGPALWDLDATKAKAAGHTSSHVKLYLLKKGEQHELWVGSANATARGIGWEPSKGVDQYSNANHKTSVECLVKFALSEEQFAALRNGIAATYAPFGFVPGDLGSLQVTTDHFGPWFCEHFEAKRVEYCDADKEPCKHTAATMMRITFAPKAGSTDTIDSRLFDDPWQWRPAEYAQMKPAVPVYPMGGQREEGMFQLEYHFDKFKPAQGALCFGPSQTLLWLPADLLPPGVPTVQAAAEKVEKDQRLTDWLMEEETCLEASGEELDDRPGAPAALYHRWLSDDMAEDWLTATFDPPKPGPMPFQTQAAERMVEILQNNSRVFLADEPGLGKTVSAAATVCKLAQKQWAGEADPTPFFCLYVAPNLTLLQKCANDFIEKSQGILKDGESIITLRYSRKEALQRALEIVKKGCIENDTAKFDTALAALVHKKEDDLPGMGVRNFLNKHIRKHKNAILERYDTCFVEADRLVNHDILLEANQPSGKTIVLLTVSAGCALDEAQGDKEKETLSGKTRAAFTMEYLKRWQPQVILWDEYHRYSTKLKTTAAPVNPAKVFFDWEAYSHRPENLPEIRPMKSIFISATPYRTNVSGKDNRDVMDILYSKSVSGEEEPEKLPSFEEDFAPLFCGGWWKDAAPDLVTLYQNYTKDPAGGKAALESALRLRMIRHERAQLQKKAEPHRRLYPPESLTAPVCAPVLRNTMAQCRRLEAAGFDEGDRHFSTLLPWINSFYTSDMTWVPPLDDSGRSRVTEDMFAYRWDGQGMVYDADKLRTLPQQNLAFFQSCRENLADDMTQLLWVPPTVPLYRPGESIFARYRDYSKLLIFAEYRYFQRGCALLLSDYASLKNRLAPTPPGKFSLSVSTWDLPPLKEVLLQDDHRDQTLDELVARVQETYHLSEEEALAAIASPAACARALEMDAATVQDAFNTYFNKEGVRDALWKWLCCHGYQDKVTTGLLRYCAEGNLYAVLEEWAFITKTPEGGTKEAVLCDVLTSDMAQVKVHAFDETQLPDKAQTRRRCSFADRLAGDVGDVKSGADKDAETSSAQRFSSPFWPMVLVVGRGAQEGLDFHQYCLRIQHMTLPRGAVSFEQRNGRIDRFRGLLVRRRAAEQFPPCAMEPAHVCTKGLLARMFDYLTVHRGVQADQLYPNWHIPDQNSLHHFQQMLPVWPMTKEDVALRACDAMLESYRRPFGTSPQAFAGAIDLRAYREKP